MFVNKYKDTEFDLSDADNNTFDVGKNEIGWIQGMDGGWTIFGVYNEEDLRVKNLPVF